MARTVRDARLETREARNKLPLRSKPHWRTLRPGELHLGYRRRRRDAPGYWTVRRYLGVDRVAPGKSPYRIDTLPGVADDFEDPNGKTVLSYAQAQDVALARQNKARGASGPLTVREAMENYLSYLRLERRTGDDAASRADALILPELGDRLVSELTTDELIRWRDRLASAPARLRTKKGKAVTKREPPKTEDERRARRATVNRTMTILKAALNRAFEHGLVDDDLAWRRVKPFANVQHARPDYLTHAEAKRLVNAADRGSGFRDVVRAALVTGCRYGELRDLRVKDFHKGKVAIHRSKSGKARDVVLGDEGVALFEQLTAGRGRDEVMLPFRPRGDGWGKSEQSRPMRAACKAAKISPPVGIHQLRHTYASLAIMGGMPLMVVARNLGHVDTRMVERHYGHLAPSFVDEQVRAAAPTFGIVEKSAVTKMRSRGAK